MPVEQTYPNSVVREKGVGLGGPGSIAGEDASQRITQSQPEQPNYCCSRPQVFSNIAFDIKPLAYRLTKLGHGIVKIAPLLCSPFFQQINRKIRGHTVLPSFRIQTWSCFSTSMVRLGARPTEVNSL